MKNANTSPRWSMMRLALSWKTFDFYERAPLRQLTMNQRQSLNWPVFCHIWPPNGVVPVVTEVVLKLYVNQWKCLHFRDKIAPLPDSKPDNRPIPGDTPLRENVPQSTLTMGLYHLIRAVFFRHVGEAAAPLQNVGGRASCIIQEAWGKGGIETESTPQ